MNTRQKKFVDEYIVTGNASEAARRAGYSDRSARQIGERLLTKDEVRRAIDSRLEKAASENTMTQSQLLEFLSAVVRGEVQDEQVMTRLIGKGCSIIEHVEFRASVKDRIRAAELLLKVQGAFDKTEPNKTSALEKFVAAVEKSWEEQDGESLTKPTESRYRC